MLSKYKNLIRKLVKNKADNESAHIIQDKIYREFIRDVVKNRFTNQEEIYMIAKEILENVVKNDKERWYN